MDIIISGDQIRYIYSDDLLGLTNHGTSTVKRASHVEPDDNGGWKADLGPVGGPILGPFKKRSDALEGELTWLTNHGVPTPK
ncbi:MAG: hypothetical protein GF411_01015 [Candidatus Lokiarchaeota archaeon]|nr:hypothetical protein [Candidatus Lokiarchaeota archaeon]